MHAIMAADGVPVLGFEVVHVFVASFSLVGGALGRFFPRLWMLAPRWAFNFERFTPNYYVLLIPRFLRVRQALPFRLVCSVRIFFF